jgi:hypothetical protein
VSFSLHRGACHVVEFISPELVEIAKFDPTGMPVREAFPDPAYRGLFAVMDRVYANGRPESTLRPSGLVTVLPWPTASRVEGVSVHLDAARAPRPLPLPAQPALPLGQGWGEAPR